MAVREIQYSRPTTMLRPKYAVVGDPRPWVSGGLTRVFFYDPSGCLLSDGVRTIEYFAGQRLFEYTDRTGNVRYSYTMGTWRHYYPFGEEITSTASDTYKFADLYRDADTGLDYAQHRYYSSTMARFLSVDRGGFNRYAPQSWNRYAYVTNDPVNSSDPTGLGEKPTFCDLYPEMWFCSRLPLPPPPGFVDNGEDLEELRQQLRQQQLEERMREVAENSRKEAQGLLKKTECQGFVNRVLKNASDALGLPPVYDASELTNKLSTLPIDPFGDKSTVFHTEAQKTIGEFISDLRRQVPGVVAAIEYAGAIYLASGFYGLSPLEQGQTILGEAMHALWSGFDDFVLAEAAGISVDRNAQDAIFKASSAFHEQLAKNCK